MVKDGQREFLRQILLDNASAVEFAELLGQITQTWDDIIDGDNEALSAEEINAAFWNLFVALPLNEFYRRHFDTLNPLLQAAIVDWWDSNELQKSPRATDKAAAYVLRDTLTTILIHCARLIGGYDWMRHVSMRVRNYLYVEDVNDFVKEHSDG